MRSAMADRKRLSDLGISKPAILLRGVICGCTLILMCALMEDPRGHQTEGAPAKWELWDAAKIAAAVAAVGGMGLSFLQASQLAKGDSSCCGGHGQRLCAVIAVTTAAVGGAPWCILAAIAATAATMGRAVRRFFARIAGLAGLAVMATGAAATRAAKAARAVETAGTATAAEAAGAKFFTAQTPGAGASGGSFDDGEGVGGTGEGVGDGEFAHNSEPQQENFLPDRVDRPGCSAPSTPGLRR